MNWFNSPSQPESGLRMPEATSLVEPEAGIPHVRFDEGRGTSVPSYSTGSVGALTGIARIKPSERGIGCPNPYNSGYKTGNN